MLENYQVNDYSFESIQQINDNLIYIDYIDAKYDFKETPITDDLIHRYQGDFFGLLKKLNIETNLYLYSLYINGLTTPYEFISLPNNTLRIPIKPPIPIG